jgi:teichuronic acid biosynthesis glycosyltransferase TuaH
VSKRSVATQALHATADRAHAAHADARATDVVAQDLVFIFGFESWSGAAKGGFSFPQDRLASVLPGHGRVRRVLVCDPFRSAPRKLARVVLRRPDTPFPASADAAHHAPVRLLRDDPVDAKAVERAYAAYERGIRRAAARHGLDHPAIVTANPLLAGFGDFRWAGPVTYYGWDDWAASEPRRRWWPMYGEAFRRLRETGRRVVAVSDRIVTGIAPIGAHAVVPNGVDPAEWKSLPSPPAWFSALPAPRLLYAGSLQSRIDVHQLRDIASAFPSGSITLVGTMIDAPHFAPLRDVANVHIHPCVSRTEIPGLIGNADVGLIPHVRSPLTEAMSPLKLYEYLAGGRPVAAVDLPGITGISDRVALVPPGGDLASAVRRSLALGPERESARLAFVDQNSWGRRFHALLDVAFAPRP